MIDTLFDLIKLMTIIVVGAALGAGGFYYIMIFATCLQDYYR